MTPLPMRALNVDRRTVRKWFESMIRKDQLWDFTTLTKTLNH